MRGYYRQRDGEWVQLASRKGYRMACCDCGLIHVLNFRVRKGKIQFQAQRDVRATARRRLKLARRSMVEGWKTSFRCIDG